MMINVPAEDKIYDESLLALATNYVWTLPERPSLVPRPIFGLSTKAETKDVSNCLRDQPVHRFLVVTSDFHTRRARAIFRHELDGYTISVAASSNNREFGTARGRKITWVSGYAWSGENWWSAGFANCSGYCCGYGVR